MKIKRAKDVFIIPKHGEVLSVSAECEGERYALMQISMAQMDKLRFKSEMMILGRPMYLCCTQDKGYLFPAPDKDIDLRIVYYPPPIEI